MNPTFDSEYTLDFGDVLKLQLIGQKSLVSDLKIERDGSVNVPEIGRIFYIWTFLRNSI